LWTADFSIGQWHQVAIHIHWSQNAQLGSVDVWFDGVQVVTAHKAQTKPDGNTLFYQQGLHRKVQEPFVDTIYIDDFIEADTFAEAQIAAPNQPDGGTAIGPLDSGVTGEGGVTAEGGAATGSASGSGSGASSGAASGSASGASSGSGATSGAMATTGNTAGSGTASGSTDSGTSAGASSAVAVSGTASAGSSAPPTSSSKSGCTIESGRAPGATLAWAFGLVGVAAAKRRRRLTARR
jgi:hypothetical protein